MTLPIGTPILVTIAAQLHEAQTKYMGLEAHVGDAIGDAIGNDAIDFDITTDHYDNSIEIYGPPPSDAVRDAAFAMGFQRVWQHPHEKMQPGARPCSCPLQSRPR